MSEGSSDHARADSHKRIDEESDELLYRQVVDPEYLDDGRPTRRVFTPHSESDELSVHRESVVSTAQRAYEVFTEGEDDDGQPHHSEGTWAVSAVEVKQSGLHGAFEYPVQQDKTPTGHSYISFANNPEESNRGRGRERWRKRHGDNLAQHAAERGIQYDPADEQTQPSMGI